MQVCTYQFRKGKVEFWKQHTENYDLQVIFNASIFCIIKTYISNHAHVHEKKIFNFQN